MNYILDEKQLKGPISLDVNTCLDMPADLIISSVRDSIKFCSNKTDICEELHTISAFVANGLNFHLLELPLFNNLDAKETRHLFELLVYFSENYKTDNEIEEENYSYES